MNVAVSFFAILLVLLGAVIAVVLVLVFMLRRRSQPRGFEVMERERHENQP